MRKFIIFLTILAFFGCLSLGFYSSNIFPKQGQANSASEANTPTSQNQRNIAIIHVDDLLNETPKLISIWGLIFYYPEPKIILQPLYPLDIEGNSDLANRFTLTSNGDPHSVFMKFLAEDNQISWDNFILVDNNGLAGIANWIFGSNPLETTDLTYSVIELEDTYYRQFCSGVMANPQNLFDNAKWNSIIPSHFHSNLQFDDFLESWSKLTRVEQPLDCQVFGK